MKRSLPIVLLCVVMTAPAFAGGPRDAVRDFGSRLRDRLIRIVRVVTNGDTLTPPFPSPKP
jgi:hypothetical protein